MPLASWYSLHFYGPGAGAMVVEAAASTVAGMNATARAASVVTASATVPLAKATRLVNAPMTVTAAGSMPLALPKARARAGAVIRVNELSQDDVSGALLTSRVEGSLTIRDVLRLLLAVGVGKTTVAGSTATFRDTADTKDRVIGTVVGGERTSVTLDPS